MTDQQDIQQAEVEGQQLRRRADEEADPNAGEAQTDDAPEVEGQRLARGPAEARTREPADE